MKPIQKIFRTYGKQYMELYGDKMPNIHKKAVRDICNCRDGTFGTIMYSCDDCKTLMPVLCCCGNRHCPSCQQYKSEEWLKREMENVLPTHYFLLTITLPQKLRMLARSNQKIVYRAMFECSHEALKKLAKDKRYVGSSRIGYLAVLHTWGSVLQYHPHIHIVIPGGAVSKDGGKWLSSRQDLFVHTAPFVDIFKAKFRDAMKKAKLFHKADRDVWKQKWVIHSESAGRGENALRYLSRYVFRVAISNNRIKSIDDNKIRFTYKDRERNTWKNISLEPLEFIRRFLQHILPKGFMKIRHYGFLNSNSAFAIDKLREMITSVGKALKKIFPSIPAIKKKTFYCECCGKPLRFFAFKRPASRWGPAG